MEENQRKKKAATTAPAPKKKRKPRQHRSKTQQAADEFKIAEYYLAGKSLAEMVSLLDISESTVKRHLKSLAEVWIADAQIDFDKARANELSKINNLEREYWVAWQRSLERRKTEALKDVGGDKPRKEKSLKQEDLSGNPSYLAGIQWCIEQRCKLLGLNAPVKVAPTGPDGKTTYKPYSLEDFGGVIAKAREYEEALRRGSSSAE